MALEGPYGVFTTLRRQHPRALLIAGGIGITPLRALMEDFPGGKGVVTLLYRASSWDDVIFKTELEELAKARRPTSISWLAAAAVPICPTTPSPRARCVTSSLTSIVGMFSSADPQR